jgi:NAD(P)-dependent dehydrogenase (short-subunit alcohol dehydrogenase family)
LSPRNALVTGGSSGIGAAIVRLLEAQGAEVAVLDLAGGEDVAEEATWRALEGSFDAAALNAGVVTGHAEIATLTDDAYRRILRTNVDGVVLGVRELAARLMPEGGSIAVTSSLAGLVGAQGDPIYSLTKHALIGFVRSVAPQLEERGIRINAICPGYADTPLVTAETRAEIDVPLIDPELVAEATLEALESGETGQAWVVQPNRIERFRFPNVPGPR